MSVVPSLAVDPSFTPVSVRTALVWGSGLPGCPRTGGPRADLEAAARQFAGLLSNGCGAAESGWLLA